MFRFSLPRSMNGKNAVVESEGIHFIQGKRSLDRIHGESMSFMIEVFYHTPADKHREDAISRIVRLQNGALTYRETPGGGMSDSVCLTYEFESLEMARQAATDVIHHGEHVEGPYSYGD